MGPESGRFSGEADPRTPEQLIPIEEKVGNAVQWWLEKEAGRSSLDANAHLDDLGKARERLLGGGDPKHRDHVMRMELWLEGLGDPKLNPVQNDELTARVIFGGLMLLSGSYRRQRYLQATSQHDYMERKLNWRDPGSVAVKEFIAEKLHTSPIMDKEALLERIRGDCEVASTASEQAASATYAGAPAEFGQENSDAVTATHSEQEAWLTFVADLIRLALLERADDFSAIPVLEHTTITQAKLVKLSDYTNGKTSQGGSGLS